MSELKKLLDDFILNSKNILYDNLIGIYLHGSLAMGCYNEKKSDIDLLIVVKNDVSREIKRRYMDMVVALNNKAPSKGIELSIVKEAVCKPFVYPTPFELHFSVAHLNWYLSNPEDYIEKMNGTDKDLAVHFTIIYHRGKTLYGKEIKSVFSEVSNETYMDSIWLDVKNAKEDIIDDTMYIILNLCRVLAYKKERLILSKQEGGEWALHQLAIDTVNLAVASRGKSNGIIFHSDRGSQFTSSKFRKHLDNLNIIQSFSAKGHPYDNAVIECFFKYLKKEEVNRRSSSSFDDLNLSLFKYINGFYNSFRPHSHNKGLSPNDFEQYYFSNS